MYELKTKINDKNVLDFLNNVENKRRKDDALVVLEIMSRLTKEEAKMWGDSIIGFGTYKYSNSTGKEFEWMKIGFSPRKQSLTLYIMNGYEHYEELLQRLGKHKLGKSCLYINKLDDIDLSVLEELISHSYDYVTKNY